MTGGGSTYSVASLLWSAGQGLDSVDRTFRYVYFWNGTSIRYCIKMSETLVREKREFDFSNNAKDVASILFERMEEHFLVN